MEIQVMVYKIWYFVSVLSSLSDMEIEIPYFQRWLRTDFTTSKLWNSKFYYPEMIRISERQESDVEFVIESWRKCQG